MDRIQIKGARTHNLKNIDLDMPRDKLIVITGLSGSGKSSLAFDTLYHAQSGLPPGTLHLRHMIRSFNDLSLICSQCTNLYTAHIHRIWISIV